MSTRSRLPVVTDITRRAWGNRYGPVVPIGKEGGARLYTQDHIDLINRVVGLLDRGRRIGQVTPFLEAEQAAQEAGQDKPVRSEDGQLFNNWFKGIKYSFLARH